MFREANLKGKAALILSTLFGIGLIKAAPGTFGTFASIPLAIGLSRLSTGLKVLTLIVIVFVAFWSSERAEKLLGEKDPPIVVIDEASGFLLATLLLPFTWLTLLSAFVLFRVFDILKPFPIRFLERRCRGGLGIVLDDLMAGFYAYVGTGFLLQLTG
jgi:phosphatidylglycerophosphatase A